MPGRPWIELMEDIDLELARKTILQAFEDAGGDQDEAAKKLGVTRGRLDAMAKRLRIRTRLSVLIAKARRAMRRIR
jgi:transcriptional regulator with GAF, ATPase, and Fis domain